MDILRKNFKNKFIILTLCFTIIFSSFNYKKTYADGGIISAPILATVVTAALGTGIVLKNHEEIYNIGRLFYDYVQNNNSIYWDTVVSAFQSSVAFDSLTKQVTLGKEFGGILKGFFDKTFGSIDSKLSTGVVNLGYTKGYPDLSSMYSKYTLDKNVSTFKEIPGVTVSGMSVGGVHYSANALYKILRDNDTHYKILTSNDELLETLVFSTGILKHYAIYVFNNEFYRVSVFENDSGVESYSVYRVDSYYLDKLLFGDTFSLLYNVGAYNPGNVWGDTDEGIKDVPIYVPGDLSDLLNGNPSDVVGDKAPGWVGNGNVSLPTVENPSIGVVDGSFPQTNVGNPSVPGTDTGTDTGIWATIKDFIISLVVPSDTFWTDTWNGLYNSFISAFPGVDMDGFNGLVTGEKKFPNIDINIMGVKGRVVNGDVINSIVDWLRPIIAGFMMLCLMFFNYRKIYKLIRNSEPFGGIAPGTSDFSTGISEYSDNYLKAKEIIGDNLRSMTGKGVK